jgi:hypothetical protein
MDASRHFENKGYVVVFIVIECRAVLDVLLRSLMCQCADKEGARGSNEDENPSHINTKDLLGDYEVKQMPIESKRVYRNLVLIVFYLGDCSKKTLPDST